MRSPLERTLYWAPRVTAILFALFLTLLALDVFSEGYSFGETVVALVMHLIPTAILLAALAVAWRWERTGGVLHLALAVLYLLLFWQRLEDYGALIVTVPLLLIGTLFLACGVYQAQQHARA